jgi:hypothetical protein
MALSPQLLQFKSSGVYRLEFDKSVTANLNVETLRLVVGHSRKGPYNTPVLISTVEEFSNVFGSIDRKLEKKGMFFHRSAIEALSRGPILALNASSFDSSDKASYALPVSNGSVHSLSSKEGTSDYTDFFDMDKFMTPSDSRVLNALSTAALADGNSLINFVNIKQSAITVFVRKAQSTKEFDIPAREWYGEGNVPEYLNDFDLVSDFMVDVFVFKGNFDAATMSADPVYGAYFNADGLIKGSLANFSNLRQVTLEAQYSGSLIPGFKDLEGRNLYIESMINAESRRTGLFCAIDEEQVTDESGTKLDLVGHTFDADQDYELLSYVVKQGVTTEHTVDLTGATVSINVATPEKLELVNVLATEYANATADSLDFLNAAAAGEYVKVTSVSPAVVNQTAVAGQIAVASGTATFAVGQTPTIALPAGISMNMAGDQTSSFIVGHFYSTDSGVTGIEVSSSTYDANANITTVIFASNVTQGGTVTNIEEWPMYSQLEVQEVFATVDFDITCEDDVAPAYTTATEIDFYHVANGRVASEDFGGATYEAAGSMFTVTYSAPQPSFSIVPGNFVPALSGRLARVLRVSKLNDSKYAVYCDVPVSLTWGNQVVSSFEDASSVYKPFALSGAKLSSKEIQDALAAVKGGNGLHAALVDKDVIDFRYVVDTFGSFDVNGLQNKNELASLAKDRQNASAILNAPLVSDFKASSNPSFKDSEGIFKVEYVETGGNLDLNPTSLYSLPGITAGANYAFYYGPGLIVSDNGKDLIVPPAAYVSNNYMDKFTNATPWSIIAGPRRGVVGGSGVKGVEYAFDKSDRDILEPFGINPIVFQRGVGLTILGNKTAQQSVKSALSSAHVREALIYIQEGIANILKDYVFEFNNTQTRLEIKTLADSFMEGVKSDGGVYAFKNIMDQTNNTDDVIDNNVGIIDTYVEPVKGLEIVVHRTTILNTGEIETGNFN